MKNWLKVLDNETKQLFKTTCNWVDAGLGTKAASVKFKKTGEVCSLCFDVVTDEIFILKEI
jgi:hypothetical protein